MNSQIIHLRKKTARKCWMKDWFKKRRKLTVYHKILTPCLSTATESAPEKIRPSVKIRSVKSLSGEKHLDFYFSDNIT